MSLVIAIALLILAAAGSYVFGTLAFSLRDYSRATLGQWFDRRARKQARRADGEASIDAGAPPVGTAAKRLDAVVEHEDELALTASVARAGANLVVVLATLHIFDVAFPALAMWAVYALAFVVGLLVVGLVSVALPLATSSHAAEPFIGTFAPLLHLKRLALWPVVKGFGPIDRVVRKAAGRKDETPEHVEEEIEKEIMDIVAEGRDEGVIDENERRMIERALRFQDTTAGQVMTPRADIVGLKADAPAEEVLRVIDESGYSRLPVYGDTPDRIDGVLYARDLFRYVGKRLNGHDSADTRVFSIADIVRKPLVVPETKRLSDLLRDMQLQKIHMAIVLDEYGGTSGLVTIEDVLEELVGEIADEHEEDEAPLFDRLDDRRAEADARIEVEELNRLMGLGLPEEEGFETLGGFVTTTLGRIPPAGTSFEHGGGADDDGPRVVFTVLDAEPQRVNRVGIELAEAATAETPEPAATSG